MLKLLNLRNPFPAQTLTILFAFILLPIAHTTAEEVKKPRLLVFPVIIKKGIGQKESPLLTELLSIEISKTDTFTILNRDDMRAMLSKREFELAMGCEGNMCLLENVKKLAANIIIVGNVEVLSTRYIVSLKLINENGQTEMEEKDIYDCPLNELDKSIEKLTYKFLKYLGAKAATSGTIKVESTPSGGKIFVDGLELGITPDIIRGVKPGVHEVEVKIDRHEGWNKTVNTKAGEEILLSAILQEKEEDYIERAKYYENLNDYEEAVNWYRKAAEQGNVQAQTSLGFIYKSGRGTDQDYHEAVKWYRKAAEQGDVYAQNTLGSMYETGEGIDQNYYEAVSWYRKSAEQGNADGQAGLGYMYDIGLGVDQNYYEAVKWFRMAAEQGNAYAQNNMGVMYESGEGIDQNYHEAVKWFHKAAEQGNVLAQTNLGNMYYAGHGIDQNYYEAVKWFRMAAEQGDALAQRNLGNIYYDGQGVHQDYKEAVKWWRKAAEQGDAHVQAMLGLIYEYGYGVEQNNYKAAKWFRMAAEQGNTIAQGFLGDMYANGRGVLQDSKEAVKWWRKAAGEIYEKDNASSATGMEFVLVKGGCFNMGDISGDGEENEKPVHEVCVNDFYIGKYEVTVGQFMDFVGETGYRTEAEIGGGLQLEPDREKWTKNNETWHKPGFKTYTHKHPVVGISWNDAQEFIKWLNKKTGKIFHLPTEVEWEYAARSAGKSYKYSWGNGEIYGNISDETMKREHIKKGGNSEKGFEDS